MPDDKDSRPLGLYEVGSYQKPAQKSHACVPLMGQGNMTLFYSFLKDFHSKYEL